MTTKQIITGAFIEKELTATEIRVLVNQYKEFFKFTSFIDEDDFIADEFSSAQVELLRFNINKINSYYDMGLIKKYLNPQKVNPFSREAFEYTGHNSINVKPVEGLGLEFLYSAKRFSKSTL